MSATPLLHEIETTVERAVREQGPAVVGIGGRSRPGTGTVIGPARVLTAAHAAVGEVTASFADGRSAPAAVVGVDRELGIAVLSVDTGEISAPEWADADAVRVGAPVVALGDPGGRGLRATLGFVAAADRSFRGSGGRLITGALEHTAPLPRGSSGAPLLDADGRLIGVNLLRLDGGLLVALGVGGGLREAAERLAAGEHTARPRLGVAVAPPRVARRMRRAVGLPERDGLLVRAVEEGSPAETAGVERGDLIAAVGAEPVEGVDTLHRAIDAGAADGKHVELTVVRGTEERKLNVNLEGGGK